MTEATPIVIGRRNPILRFRLVASCPDKLVNLPRPKAFVVRGSLAFLSINIAILVWMSLLISE